MGVGTFQSPTLSLPDAAPSLTAHVDQINAAGGVNGRKVKLILCDDKDDPNTAADCARRAVSEKVVAVLETYTGHSPQIVPVLEAAKIPLLYNPSVASVDGTSDISFPRDTGVMSIYAGLGIELAKAGCKKGGAVVLSVAPTQLAAQWLERGFKAQGASFAQASVGATQADFSAPVAKLLSQGVDCLVPVTAPDQGPKIVIAAQQSGKKVRIGAVSSEFSSTALKTLGASAEGMIITGAEYLPADTAVPAVKDALDGMKQYQPNVAPVTAFSMDGWASVTALEQVLQNVDGQPTAESVLQAAGKTSPKTGLLADFSWQDEAPDTDFPRVKNWGYLVWTVKSGKAVLSSDGFVQAKGIF